jgi:ATP-dependent DNA helicase RecQ
MLDFLPKEAKLRRRVMQAVEKVVGKRRGEDVFVRPTRLMEIAQVDRDQLSRTLRELGRLQSFDYVPPFRGRAVHFTERDVPFEQLEIDFADLDHRKAGEFDKLEAVIKFARTSGCRQRVILNYFGDCDRCQPAGGSGAIKAGNKVSIAGSLEGVDPVALLCGIRVVLSGVTRMHGRFGKNMVAQMLCGSRSKKLQQWKLHRLSTYGMLSDLKQTEVAAVIDALVEGGLLIQREVDDRRPTIDINDAGKQVMHATEPLPASIVMSFPLAKRLAIAARRIESRDVPRQTADAAGTEAGSDSPELSAAAVGIRDRLKRWRRRTSAAMGIPAYRVLTNATIERIADMMPNQSEQLEAVSGIGAATMEQYGYDILQIVQQVIDAAEGGIDAVEGAEERRDPPALQQPPRVEEPTEDFENLRVDPPQDSSGEDHQPFYWTWRLFFDGYSVAQITQIRRCNPMDLLRELQAAGASGLEVQPEWGLSIREFAERESAQPTGE